MVEETEMERQETHFGKTVLDMLEKLLLFVALSKERKKLKKNKTPLSSITYENF